MYFNLMIELILGVISVILFLIIIDLIYYCCNYTPKGGNLRENKKKEKKISKIPIAVPGFPNYNPKQQVIFNEWLSKLENNCKSNGFTALEVPLFVRKEFLRVKMNDDNEIYSVSRLNKDCEDEDLNTKFGLPFDNTVPLALWIRDNIRDITFPYKRYAINPVYRGENPSPGRFRGFYQCDVDIIGPSLNIMNEIQCLHTLIKGLEEITYYPFTVYINNISITKNLFRLYGIDDENIKVCLNLIDRIEKDGYEEIKNKLSKFTNKNSELIDKLTYKGEIEDFVISDDNIIEALDSLNNIITKLSELGIRCVKFSPSIIRGLNYYTGLVFETYLDNEEKAISIMSGGRYDNLVDNLSNKKSMAIMGVGGSIGISRIFDILTRKKVLEGGRKSAADVIVIYRDIKYNPWIVAETLRNNNINTDVYTGNANNISKQLDYANKLGIPIVVMVMDKSVYCIKNLKTKEQMEVTSIDELVNCNLLK